MPSNSLPIDIKTATVTNSVGATVPLAPILGVAYTIRTETEGGYPAFNSWKSFNYELVGGPFENTIFTTFVPGSSYYILVGQNFTINIPRRNSYLITNDARFITTNNGNYIVVSKNP
jgi:hypothetical protein